MRVFLANDTPLVSVLIPTYNRSSLIGNAIESVLAQTYENYEIIIIDDGSTDDTGAVVNKFNSLRIKYIYQENKGRSAARNLAFNLSQGDYIAFLDSDDMFHPQKIELQVAHLESHPEYGMSYTSARVIDEQGKEIFRDDISEESCPYYRAVDSGWLYDKIVFYIPVTVLLPTVMVRADVLRMVGGFDEAFLRFEDTDLWRRLAKVTPILALDEPLTTVLTHSGNRMVDPDREYLAVAQYVDKIFRDDGIRDPVMLRAGASRLFLHYGLAVFAGYDHKRAMEFFVRSFVFEPTLPTSYFLKHRLFNWKRSVIFTKSAMLHNPFAALEYFSRYLSDRLWWVIRKYLTNRLIH